MENLEAMIKQLNLEKNKFGKKEKAKLLCQTIITHLKENPKTENYGELKNVLEKLINFCEDYKTSQSLPTLYIPKNKEKTVDDEIKTKNVKKKVAEIAVIGMENIKRKLEEAVGLPLKHPELFLGKRKSPKTILLYGPPGTGKTHVIDSLAKFDVNIIKVSASDLFSKYQGDSEKHVRKVFDEAFAAQPSLIFIDEIDFLCRRRGEGDNESNNRIKSELLIKLNQIDSEKSVFLLGATNFPWMLDNAFIRRFSRKIYVGLPKFEERYELLKYFLNEKNIKITEAEYEEIGKYTAGFSNSDLKQLCERILCEGISDLNKSKCFYKEDNLWKMCKICDGMNKCIRDKKFEYKNNFAEVDGTVENPITTYNHFVNVKNFAKPTVISEDLVNFDVWTKKYGEGRDF